MFSIWPMYLRSRNKNRDVNYTMYKLRKAMYKNSFANFKIIVTVMVPAVVVAAAQASLFVTLSNPTFFVFCLMTSVTVALCKEN